MNADRVKKTQEDLSESSDPGRRRSGSGSPQSQE